MEKKQDPKAIRALEDRLEEISTMFEDIVTVYTRPGQYAPRYFPKRDVNVAEVRKIVDPHKVEEIRQKIEKEINTRLTDDEHANLSAVGILDVLFAQRTCFKGRVDEVFRELTEHFKMTEFIRGL